MRALFGLLILPLLAGCMHLPSPHVPADWLATKLEIDAIDAPDAAAEARLQVLVVYLKKSCGHTALRLVMGDRPALFWDPGGSWGDPIPPRVDFDYPAPVQRHADVVVATPPTLRTYLDYRDALGNQSVEVFEWGLDEARATELYRILTGARAGQEGPDFSTRTSPMFCSSATSRFLHRFAGDIVDVPERFFFPHRLSRTLFSQPPETAPDRVFVYRPPTDTLVELHPPGSPTRLDR